MQPFIQAAQGLEHSCPKPTGYIIVLVDENQTFSQISVPENDRRIAIAALKKMIDRLSEQ